MKNKSAHYIGRVCTFYIPASKLDDKSYTHEEILPREILHEYFVINHNAYTHEISNIKGWRTVEPKSGEIYGNLKENLAKSVISNAEIQG
jgi:hypothetical protein